MNDQVLVGWYYLGERTIPSRTYYCPSATFSLNGFTVDKDNNLLDDSGKKVAIVEYVFYHKIEKVFYTRINQTKVRFIDEVLLHELYQDNEMWLTPEGKQFLLCCDGQN